MCSFSHLDQFYDTSIDRGVKRQGTQFFVAFAFASRQAPEFFFNQTKIY